VSVKILHGAEPEGQLRQERQRLHRRHGGRRREPNHAEVGAANQREAEVEQVVRRVLAEGERGEGRRVRHDTAGCRVMVRNVRIVLEKLRENRPHFADDPHSRLGHAHGAVPRRQDEVRGDERPRAVHGPERAHGRDEHGGRPRSRVDDLSIRDRGGLVRDPLLRLATSRRVRSLMPAAAERRGCNEEHRDQGQNATAHRRSPSLGRGSRLLGVSRRVGWGGATVGTAPTRVVSCPWGLLLVGRGRARAPSPGSVRDATLATAPVNGQSVETHGAIPRVLVAFSARAAAAGRFRVPPPALLV
jgi:hypothetical protein